MILLKDNRIVVDLKKIAYARFYYASGIGLKRNTLLPDTHFSSYGTIYLKNEAIASIEPPMTFFERATMLGHVDKWTPTLYLQLSNGHSLIYKGDKALSIFDAWRAIVFSKQNKKKTK